MRKVEIKQKKIFVGSKKVPLISGEVHYWRLNPSYWKPILEKVKEMGLSVVSTYVPWDYHEYKRGSFDFTGKTDQTRNLKKFLNLTRQMGFWLLIRPGPYIYSEWPNDGIPSYAYKYHRLHPKFLALAENYLRHVTKIIKPYLASHAKGHIVLVQADNEIDPWPDVFGHQYGLSEKPGMFQKFLKNRYHGEIQLLNQLWGTSYQRFEEAGPYIACMMKNERGLALKGDKELKRNLDYFEFKYHYAHQVADWNVKMFKSLGIDVPVYLNLYPFFYAHDWARMNAVSDLVGIDLYPSGELAEDEHEQRKLIDKVRYLSSFSRLPYIAEFASGVWHARHYESGVLTPNHYRLITLSALLGGIAGWNWYMLVNRDNWYMSPINEWGRPRHELFAVFKDLVSIAEEMKPYDLEKLTNIAVTINPIQYAARTMPADSNILTALYEADVDYELFNPEISISRKPILFYSGNQWLSRKAQTNLRRYVESGGILVAFRNFPRKDDDFENCNILDFHEPSRILFEFKRQFTIDLGPHCKTDLTSSVFAFDSYQGKPIKVDFQNYGLQTIGYQKKVGKGSIFHLGVEPGKELILNILKYFKINLFSHSTTRDVKTALFKNKNSYYVVAVNNGKEDKSVHIRLTLPSGKIKRMSTVDLSTHQVEEHYFRMHPALHFDIPRKDGKVIKLKFK
ncbi:MAG: hypothetical protein COV74_03615 [Candidatus Omnitrophica bacterium CG11_big_fil_rev_8_21_14_0_20_45_26]|uniref:Uncharacterized protein n=1 Tax=Candidatus Abzuiibacterium crystallinum TaxID=1974748 RepID=A0A2H0LTA8_9BACT|nr:MAG: hypothetical protein COV74_03615 [Candidatus Omnitrophica bacterium CG11_big_fil_rev_8_21_14_0_20_45_26]PIW63335.1 MAG: hypothetical protein COW12_10745 [Candidatus Omnitrophica bacterium CG12_big_fil_rev_8_21_14_0_65_45_16]